MSSGIEIQGMDRLRRTLAELIKVTNANAIAARITSVIGNATRRALTKEASPFTGAKWKRLNPEYARHKKKKYGKKKILERGGNLKKIISRKVGEGERVIGTTAMSAKGYPYPAVHQYGSVKNSLIPARPFFPIDEDGDLAANTAREIDEDLQGILRKALEGKKK
ncbi:MAG: phage virion morphogenesis protein [Helicobacteraceae bacterium]|jgi:phage virion morphogenesis protein|nr:phage virion morphogenesis protein [Helicobacteraceae bacterium]